MNAKKTADKQPMKTWVKVVIGLVIAAVLAVTAGPFIYINFIKDDAPKSAQEQGLPNRDTVVTTDDSPAATSTVESVATTVESVATTVESVATSTSAAPAEATTTVGSTTAEIVGDPYIFTPSDDTYVGYRVVEVLFGQDTEGVGRTNSVSGSLALSGTQITATEFTVDMATLTSDQNNRDNKFKGQIMETSTFPTATFVLTQPIELGEIPADGVDITATATGDLTLHGVTKSVTIEVTAQRTGGIIDVLGSTDIVFADYDIDNPSTGGITTQDHGLLEFVLTFTKA